MMNFMSIMGGTFLLFHAHDKGDFWMGCGATAIICISIMTTLFNWLHKDMKNERDKANNFPRPY